MDEMTELSQAMIEFLKSHPLISLNKLEKDLDIPQSTLSKAVKGHRMLPEKYEAALCNVLSDYGFYYQ